MTYDTVQLAFVGACRTPEETAALSLHYEIMAAAQTAAAGLLELARKIKRMRDTGGYKALGFDTLEAYTAATMGMKQRQAYNYIAIAEKLPAQLIEQNAAAGVTKLALLAQLSGAEQQQITAETDLADTTVADLKQQIKELQDKNSGYAQQLSLLQSSAEDDRDKARREGQDTARAELEQAVKRQKRAEKAAESAQAALKTACEELETEKQRRADAVQKAVTDAEAKLKAEAKQAAEKENAAKLAALAAEQVAAEKRAEQLAKQLEVTGDESTVRFSVLFDELQYTAGLLDELVRGMPPAKADKFRAALRKALQALADQMEGGA